ncbi:ankyrin repeat-containing protein At5g02620 [Cucumis sativus]|uniref:ankyrin repeat-containing protein At5g02620 n=1 Tax=Cucumis sativus TaxID=3659 RepID=UPI0012F50F8C|nr:ankyrin repeat-containing protein At5g02620 [Cucumis sativus]
MKVNKANDTALHVAAMAKQTSFIEKLVQLCSPSDLAAKNQGGNTALHWAASSGVVRNAELMVQKNPDLPHIHDSNEVPPLLRAVIYKRKHMASFLFFNTNFEALETTQPINILVATINSGFYDIALNILEKKPELAQQLLNEDGEIILHELAKKPFAIGSSNDLSFWKRHINSCFKGVYKKARMHTSAHQLVERLSKCFMTDLSVYKILTSAAAVGNVELLITLIRQNPQLIWLVDEDYKSLFHFNMLHLVGMLAAPCHLNRVSGAALQMQRELLWFKEVEKIILSDHVEVKCNQIPKLSTVEIRTDDPADKLTPRELFSKQHKQLLKDGEQWMKNTANSCMLVATLITTVVFAAAFTVPGGNNDKDGTPIFQQHRAFTIFVISDVSSLVLSSTSILTFLSILTSRYTEDDFLKSLPSKLLFGLLTLFVSIACMVIAFSATFFIAYDKTKTKFPLTIAAVSIIPIGFFLCISL